MWREEFQYSIILVPSIWNAFAKLIFIIVYYNFIFTFTFTINIAI